MKVAVVHSSRKIPLRVCLYLIPVALSFAILQLSFRHVYWRGTGSSDSGYLSRYTMDQVLNFLQIVWKAHEILIAMSLSNVVLRYLRRQFVSSEGVTFGLSSAYQVTLGGAPFSYDFWRTCKRCLRRETFNWHTFSVINLLILVTVLGLTVGPSSAIAVIPRLQEWQYRDLFTFYEKPRRENHDFQLYIPKQLFPRTMDGSNLPGPYCLIASLDVNSTCPFAGFNTILPLFNIADTSENNLTVSDGTGLNRRMTTQLILGAFGASSIDKAGKHTVGGT